MKQAFFAQTGRLLFSGVVLVGLLLATVDGVAQARMPLRDALRKLNQKRGIFFLYDPNHINGHTVAKQISDKTPIETVLQQLLTGTNLTFRKIGDCYLIEPPTPGSTIDTVATIVRKRFTISGFVVEKEGGERLAGATVAVSDKWGTTTNAYGFYSLTIPQADAHDLMVSLVGYQRAYQRVRLDRPLSLIIELTPNAALDEVVLTSEATERACTNPQTGQHTIPISLAENVPAVAGEKDILKTLQWLPGVQKGLDGQVGLHVRGGGADQNLLILDEAPVYNANHLFGFFSVFNVDALKSVRLQKGGFSARYGGRLSSVLDLNMREGNRQQLRGEVGTGLVASRLLVEGPMLRNRASFLLTARRTNFPTALGGFVAGLLNDNSGANWRAGFYDLNAKVNAELNPRNRLYLSGYFGRDFFNGTDSLSHNRLWENAVRWGNATGTLRWNHLFSERLFSNLSLIYSNYGFSTHTQHVPTERSPASTTAQLWRYFDGLTDMTLKYDVDFFPSPAHQLHGGVVATRRLYQLNGIEVNDPANARQLSHVAPEQSLETALYAEDTWTLNRRITLNAGGRATLYRIHQQSYVRAEPRVSVSARLNETVALRASYSEMNQFIHLLSNTGQGLPTDLWVPATARLKPQRARQFVLGLAHDLTPKLQLSVEGYQKQMSHIIGYHPNADFIGLTSAQEAGDIRWERNVTSGNGTASGVELMVQKRTGRFTGWAAYTWATTRWQFDELNNGQPFYPAHDRRHSLSVVSVYTIAPTLRLSANWTYSSGNPQSLPVSGVPGLGHLGLGGLAGPDTQGGQTFGNENALIQARGLANNFRAEPFHRLDLSIQKTFKGVRLAHVLEVSVVNAYGRRNPFYYDLQVNGNRQLTLQRVSLFAFLPSLNYTLRF